MRLDIRMLRQWDTSWSKDKFLEIACGEDVWACMEVSEGKFCAMD